MKELKTFDVCSANDKERTHNINKKGNQDNPFTRQEYEDLSANGLWKGGYVDSVGYIEPEKNIDSVHNTSMYDMFYFDGVWPGGYVDGLGYVAPEVVIEPASGIDGDAVDVITMNNAFKEGIYSMVKQYEDIGTVGTQYFKLNKLCGKGLGVLGVYLSAKKLAETGSTADMLKVFISAGMMAAGPWGTLAYTCIDLTGGVDFVVDKLAIKIDEYVR